MTEAKYALEQMNSISNRKFSTKNAFNVDSDQTSKQYKKLLDRALRLYVNDTDLNENETSIEKIPSSSQPLFFCENTKFENRCRGVWSLEREVLVSMY